MRYWRTSEMVTFLDDLSSLIGPDVNLQKFWPQTQPNSAKLSPWNAAPGHVRPASDPGWLLPILVKQALSP